nr:uncharacterized protein LOC111421200 [Onthophagus taurus]
MNEIELKIQKSIVQLCKFLPDFVNKWKDLLNEGKKPIRGLLNLSEQLRHVESVNKAHEEDFFEMQQRILFSIYVGIEEEMEIIKKILDKLNKLNNDMKSKFSTVENASLSLDFDNESSVLIKGSALQPSLILLLNLSLDFVVYFVSAWKNIQSTFKSLDVRKEKLMEKFEESFDVDLENSAVHNLLAITQYVDNDKGLS